MVAELSVDPKSGKILVSDGKGCHRGLAEGGPIPVEDSREGLV